MGYLNYDRTRRVYFPTMRVAALGEWIPSYLFGRGEALELLRDLNYATGETVSLAIRNDVYVNYIAVIESSHPLRFHLDEGSMRLLHRTTLGWVFLASMKASESRVLLQRSIAAEGEAGNADMEVIWEQVLLARERGYGYAENTPFLGSAALAVQLPIKIRGQATVLGLGGALERLRESRSRYLGLITNGVDALKASMERDHASPDALG